MRNTFMLWFQNFFIMGKDSKGNIKQIEKQSKYIFLDKHTKIL